MAEKEIKIGFAEAKMEALEFFLRENNETVESILKAHLDKTYEKCVPQQVRKFVESKMSSVVEEIQNETGTSRHSRGQGRRGTRQNAGRENVQEQEAVSVTETENSEAQEEQTESAITMGM